MNDNFAENMGEGYGVGVNHKFINAVRKGNLRELEKLINSHGIPDLPNWPKGYVLLRFAIESKDIEIVKLLLNNGSEVNNENEKLATTPLHYAVKNDDIEMVEILLNKGAKIDAKDISGLTPLHIAVQFGRLEIVECILMREPSIDTIYNSTDGTKKGYTLMHFAAQRGDGRIINFLLTKGSNVDAKTDDNLTPLHMAVEKKHLTAVEFLLEHGADVDAKTRDNQTPLNFAVGIGCPLIVESILNHRPDPNEECNRSALRSAIFRCGREFEKIIKQLLNYGFAIKPEDASDSHLVFSAVHNGHEEIVEILLKYGADANYSKTVARTNKSLLQIANARGHESIVELLIDYGADINAKDTDGNSPIFSVIRNGNLRTVKLLLNHGADVKHSFEPLRLAIENKFTEIVEILLNYNAEMNGNEKHGTNALHSTVSIDGNEEILKLILKRGIDVDARKRNGKTALHIAVENKRTAMVDLLLEYNADVNFSSGDNVTPLHLAAINGSGSIATMLLDKGANINAEQADGKTALHIAAINGCSEVVDILLIRGAEYDPRSKRDAKLLHMVTAGGHGYEVEALLNYGAEIDSVDDGGETALHIAAKYGHVDIVTFLLDHGSDINIVSNENRTALDLAIAAKTSLGNQFICRTYRNPDRQILRRIIEYISYHMIQMKCANLYVSERNLDAIDLATEEFHLRSRCENEIEDMKNEFITGDVSFYDILTKNDRQLEMYFRNEKILEVLSSDDYKRKFPIYSGMIANRFKRGLEKNYLLEQSSKFFYVLSPEVPILPHDCIMKILSYLGNRELRFMKIASSQITNI